MAEKKRIKKKTQWVRYTPTLLGLVLGFSMSVYLFNRLEFASLTLKSLIWFSLFALAGVLVNVNLHELGHCLLGSAFGYRLISYRVGVFAWNYENGRMRFSWMKNKGYGGMCAMLPPVNESQPWQQILFYGGGLLANYLTAIVSFWLAFSIQASASRSILIVFGLTALSLALLNSIPLVVGNNPTDGNILWAILLKKPNAKKMIYLNHLITRLAAGTRPRDLVLPEPWPMSEPYVYDMTLQIHRYFQLLDLDEWGKARDIITDLERNESIFPHHALPALFYEISFLAAVFDDHSKARKYHQKAGSILMKDQDINGYRVKAYYSLYVDRDLEEALRLADLGLSVAHHYPLRGQAEMEIDLLQEVKSRIQNERNLLNGIHMNHENGQDVKK